MSYIINKSAPPGSSSKNTDVSFNNQLVNYGDSFNTIDQEIKVDFLRELKTVTQSAPFSRSSGIGIDLYENETLSELNKVKIVLDIMSAVNRYNDKVLASKRIVVSQDFIFIENGPDGELIIDIYYVIEAYIGTDKAFNNIQNVTLPI